MNANPEFSITFSVVYGIPINMNARIKRTSFDNIFHVLTVCFVDQSKTSPFMNDFFIQRCEEGCKSVWVHKESKITSLVAQAIGEALETQLSLSSLHAEN